jgi:3-hydroxyisobutyrate dehydrogenase-like beta-hydroxyacid dehydrogenase
MGQGSGKSTVQDDQGTVFWEDHAVSSQGLAGREGAGKIALIGFGEAGQAFVKGWGAARAARTWVYDIKTDHAEAAVRDAKRADYVSLGVTGCASPVEALDGADLVVCVVTADQAAKAAEAAARRIAPGAFYFDCNSCAPGTKAANAGIIEAAGGRYVDTAVMAPVYPRMHKTPLLLSGPHAADALAVLAGLDMDNAKTVDGPVGASSSIKMIRSVMMKGMEALFLECVLAGRRAGVDGVVLDSLDVTYPGFDFKAKAAYMMERAMTHGLRRAAEMREVARTVEDLGLGGAMAAATADWEQRVGDLGITAEGDDYGRLADDLLAGLFPREDAA